VRAAGVELAPPVPAPKPFFYGYWQDVVIGATDSQLLIYSNTLPYKQAGMQLVNGGCQVPRAGIYQIGLMGRSDISGSGPTYSSLEIRVNGGMLGQSIANNGAIANNVLPYAYHQLWLPTNLRAGDVVTAWAYANPVACTFFGSGWPGDGLRVMYDSPLSEMDSFS
jgi:hypothetical protein